MLKRKQQPFKFQLFHFLLCNQNNGCLEKLYIDKHLYI